MMYKVNDYVLYGSTGVCRIEEIEHSGDGDEYYILQPAYTNNLTIKTPVNNLKVMMRPLLTKDEVLSLIATMPKQKPFSITDKKERSNSFRAALRSGNNKELIKVIKTLHLEKEEKSAINKKLAKTDEDMMNTAERQLHEEFAIVLGISPDEVVPFITEYISTHNISM